MTGKKIRELRKANNLTMSELANICKISQSYISDLENGNVKNPSITKMEKIAEALGVSLAELVKKEVKDKKIKPFASETLYKGEKYTKELRAELVDLYFKKKKCNNIDNILNDMPIEVREYIDILKEIIEKTEIYYDQINHKHIIEKKYHENVMNEIRELSSSIASINNENE